MGATGGGSYPVPYGRDCARIRGQFRQSTRPSIRPLPPDAAADLEASFTGFRDEHGGERAPGERRAQQQQMTGPGPLHRPPTTGHYDAQSLPRKLAHAHAHARAPSRTGSDRSWPRRGDTVAVVVAFAAPAEHWPEPENRTMFAPGSGRSSVDGERARRTFRAVVGRAGECAASTVGRRPKRVTGRKLF